MIGVSFSLLTNNLLFGGRVRESGAAVEGRKGSKSSRPAPAGKSPGGELCLPIGTLLSADFELWPFVIT